MLREQIAIGSYKMKSLNLKLISILIPALAMVSVANAAISLCVNGDTSISELTMNVGNLAEIGVYSDTDGPYAVWLCLIEPGVHGDWTGVFRDYIEPPCRIQIYPPPWGPSNGWWFIEVWSATSPIPPGKHFEAEFCCLSVGDCIIELKAYDETTIDSITIHQTIPDSNEPDLGDAPDSTNNSGVLMTTYPGSGVQANYPTVYNDGNDTGPRGPIHKQPLVVAYLGEGVTCEQEADYGWDDDTNNNINPQTDSADKDGADDRIGDSNTIVIWLLDHGPQQTFSFEVTVVSPNVPLYVNAWFDWNQDGDWDDAPKFCGHSAPEWAVQNQQLLFSKSGIYTVRSKPFTSWDSLEDPNVQYIWMRITLSEQPWTGSGSGGSGPPGGYQYGETEDYLLRVLFPSYSYCFPTDHRYFCEWFNVGRPDCWCYPRQCHGDTDNKTEGGPKTGYYYVHFNDLNVLLAGWNVREPALPPIPSGPGIVTCTAPSGVPCVCADFKHDQEGGAKTGYYRVHFNDLNILIASWNILEPAPPPIPSGPGVKTDCLNCP